MYVPMPSSFIVRILLELRRKARVVPDKRGYDKEEKRGGGGGGGDWNRHLCARKAEV